MVYRVVITTYGSLGDLYPYVGLALELKERGYQAIIATNELHRFSVEARGIGFYPVRPDVSFLRCDKQNEQRNKEIIRRSMNYHKGTKYLIRKLILPHLSDSYHDLMKAVQGADLLITHPLSFAGPLVVEKTGIRWVSSVLAPNSLLSAFDPAVLRTPYGRISLQRLKPEVNRCIFGVGKHLMRSWTASVRQLRISLGLLPGLDPLFGGQNSPNLVLALFSESFAKSQIDWPKQTRITGFALYDDANQTDISPELSRFLGAGPAPIVFTLGSAAVYSAGNFYLESINAAKQLGYRAVLLTGECEYEKIKSLLSAEDRENIAAFDYAPYSKLFPHSAAVVHQGGIGTTAQGLKAGIPMVIVPFSHDQPDNAARAERLGVARTISRTSYTAARVAKELKYLLSSPRYAKQALELRQHIQAEDGVRVACDAIEALLNSKEKGENNETWAGRL